MGKNTTPFVTLNSLKRRREWRRDQILSRVLYLLYLGRGRAHLEGKVHGGVERAQILPETRSPSRETGRISGDPGANEIELARLQMMTIIETGVASKRNRIHARHPKRSSRRSILHVLRSGVRCETPKARLLGRTPGAEGRLATPGQGGGGGRQRTES